MSHPGQRILFGLKVRQLRQDQHLSFAELAARTGLSVSFLNEIEKGKKYPRPERLKVLAEGLQCTPEWLAGEDPGPHLAPVAALLQSNFLNELPLDLFGIDHARVLELLATAPLQVSAFVSSLVELAQHHALGADHFYLSAMRAYQELHNNYFPELEAAARACRQAYGLEGDLVDSAQLKRILINAFGVRIVRDGLSAYPELGHLRSVWVPRRQTLLLHPGLSEEQLLFQLAKELGFHYLGLDPRPHASTVQRVQSFSEVLHNFKAGYFAVALLIDEATFLDRLGVAFGASTFEPRQLLDWLAHYRVSPDVLFQRLNVLTAHWGLDNVFFHRLVYRVPEGRYILDKELHLYRLERRYAGRPDEQYCRRWLSSRLIGRLQAGEEGPVTGMARVRYAGSSASWLCLGLARRSPFRTDEYVGLMIGVLLQEKALQRLPFAEAVAEEGEIGLTCERCPLMDCPERAAPPRVLEQKKQRQAVWAALQRLTE